MKKPIVNKPCDNPNFNPDLDAETTYCDHCNKHVKNLTKRPEASARRWAEKNPKSCVTVRAKKRIRYPKTLMLAVLLNSSAGYATLAHAVSLNDSIPFVERCIIASADSRAVITNLTGGLFTETVEPKFKTANQSVVSGNLVF